MPEATVLPEVAAMPEVAALSDAVLRDAAGAVA
jgi:hypothetical protein